MIVRSGPHFNRWQAAGLAVALLAIVLLTAFHNPFGGYVRDDGLYSRVELIRLLREGFSAYPDMSDEELLTRFMAKYPAAKTWVREETDGSPPMPIAFSGQPANYHLKPPPAYYGSRPRTYSRHALFPWIEEPMEFAGFAGTILLAAIAWLWIFRDRKSRGPSDAVVE